VQYWSECSSQSVCQSGDGQQRVTIRVHTRGVHGSGKPHGNPMEMGIAIRLMMGMGMGIKPMGMGIAYISRVKIPKIIVMH